MESPHDGNGGGDDQAGSDLDDLFSGKLKVQWDNLMKRITEREDEDAVNLLRVKKTDTERSKMLREVLVSAARSNLEMHGQSPIMHPQLDQRIVARSRQEGRQRSASSTKWGQQLDSDPFSQPWIIQDLESGLEDFVSETSGANDLDRILKRSSRRIAGLHGRLQDSDTPPPRSESKASRSHSSSNIRVVARPEEAGSVDDLRADRCAAKFLDNHLRFEELDRLRGTLEQSDSFNQLRASFPERVKYHDTVAELHDHLLRDSGAFRRAVLTPEITFRRVVVTPQLGSKESAETQRRSSSASMPRLNSRKELRHPRA